jgi:hypothetical protein
VSIVSLFWAKVRDFQQHLRLRAAARICPIYVRRLTEDALVGVASLDAGMRLVGTADQLLLTRDSFNHAAGARSLTFGFIWLVEPRQLRSTRLCRADYGDIGSELFRARLRGC